MTSAKEVPYLYNIPVDLNNNFKLPEHGSDELMHYITNLKTRDNKLIGQKAIENIPIKDINLVLNKINPRIGPELINQVSILRHALAYNRLANRICEQCGDKNDIIKLMICEDCCLSWYCSKECQVKHWNTHQLRCCNEYGPLDKGYQAIFMGKIDK
jgi:hypothetical protein